MSESWVDDDGPSGFLRMLKQRRDARLVLLIGTASKSPDPAVRDAWAHYHEVDMTISELEAERDRKRPDGD